MTRVAVMGSGSWGTAYAMVLADAGTDVVLWGKDPAVVAAVNDEHQNPKYHPGIELPATLWATGDVAEALEGTDVVVLAIPSQVLRENLAGWRKHLSGHSLLVSLMKGIELGTTMRMSEVIAEVAEVPSERVAVVSGPNLAREIVQRQPAATVVACTDDAHARLLQDCSLTAYFRPYTNNDVLGVEIGGATKNVIALANGIAAGLGFGDNTQSSLITRGLAETARLGIALGADPMTFSGLAGVGDLVATCTSPLVAEPDVRREPRQGPVGRGDHRSDPSDLRGRQVLSVDPRPRAQARRRHASDRAGGRRGAPRSLPAGDARPADVS